MTKQTSRAVLLAAGHLASRVPFDLQRKEAPDIAELLEQHTKATEDALKKATEENAELRGEITQLAQRMAQQRNGGRFDDETDESWARAFSTHDGLKSTLGDGQRDSFSLAIKSSITSAAGSAGSLSQPARDEVTVMPRRNLMVRDLLPVIRVTAGSVEYPNQTTRENNAAPVAEGALKPESGLAWELKNTPIRTIAHWIPASRQILEDVPQLEGLINTELLAGLADVEDRELLLGDGTGQHLLGLIPQATPYVAPIVLADATMIDTIGLAILQCALANLPADGIVLHPSDWTRMRLIKDMDGKYLLGDPGSQVQPRLFGLPVVQTVGMAEHDFLVGGFKRAATLYDRWEARIEASTQDRDNFIRNMVTLLAEERVGLAVKQKKALTHGSFE